MSKEIPVKNAFITVIAFATIASAQTPPADPVVANINGETITRSKLNALYDAIPAAMRAQYDRAGGKRTFLDNYIAKRLIIQEAVKKGFDQRDDIKAAASDAARDSMMFDRYVREVIAPHIVPETSIRAFYDQRTMQFAQPEKVKARHIFISTIDRRPDQALEKAQNIFSELQAYRITHHANSDEGRALFATRFAEAARKYSDEATAHEGGDLGWIMRGQRDPKFEDAAFTVPVGIMSGIVGTDAGYHFILIEDRQPGGIRPFEDVRRDIREALYAAKQGEIMTAVGHVTTELRRAGSVTVYAEAID